MTRLCFAAVLLMCAAWSPSFAIAQAAGPTASPSDVAPAPAPAPPVLAPAPAEPAPSAGPPALTPDEPAANDPLALDPAPTGPQTIAPAAPAPGAPMAFVGDGAAFLPQRRGVSWDLQLEGGLGVALRNDLPHTFFGRARAGMLIMREPNIYAFGAMVEVGGLTGLGFGGQLDAIHLASGMSLEAGLAVADKDEAVMHLGLGYALFGVEWQHRFASDSADALMFKLRIPIGIGYFLFTNR